MPESLPEVYLARHGQTAWSKSGQHTGRSDIPLTADGEGQARALGARLRGRSFAAVLTSPLQRARRTAELAGFGEAAVDADLSEWDYGDYDGLRTDEIHLRDPSWDLFRDGCPGGESAEDVGRRADRVVARLRAVPGDALVFAHGHVLRVLASRWLGLPATGAAHFALSTATLSILGYEHSAGRPVLRLWNDDRHLQG